MASATTRPTFSFHLHSSHAQPSRMRPKTLVSIPTFFSQKFLISPTYSPPKLQFTSKSVDVSKEDTPISGEPVISGEPDLGSPISGEPDLASPIPETEKFDRRRLQEKFAVLNTGVYECRSCGHRYDEAVGDPSYPIPPGLPFDKLPEDWRCPTCGAAQSFFVSKSVEIAGFAENQQFGLGANALTSGQKAVLIYGSLFFFFVLFLSGYFLQ